MTTGMPGIAGIGATRATVDEDPGARILVLTITAEEEEVLDALLAGACGYLLRDAEFAEIVSGLRAGATGDRRISPLVVTRLVARLREQVQIDRVQAPPKPPPLTPRERDLRGDRSRARYQPGDGQDPRRASAHQAEPRQPGPGGRLRRPSRHRLAVVARQLRH